MKTLTKGSYVMDKRTGRCYILATSTVQTLGRRQCISTYLRHRAVRWPYGKQYATTVRIAESQLIPLSDFEGTLCEAAEKIYRCKAARSFEDRELLKQHKKMLSCYGLHPSILEYQFQGSH